MMVETMIVLNYYFKSTDRPNKAVIMCAVSTNNTNRFHSLYS